MTFVHNQFWLVVSYSKIFRKMTRRKKFLINQKGFLVILNQSFSVNDHGRTSPNNFCFRVVPTCSWPLELMTENELSEMENDWAISRENRDMIGREWISIETSDIIGRKEFGETSEHDWVTRRSSLMTRNRRTRKL